MPKVSEEHLAARRRGIVRAAARCLERNGLAGTGMRDVFRAANLSPGAVYGYFTGKEELLAAVAAETGDSDGPELDRGFGPILEAAAGSPTAALELELRAAALRIPAVAAALSGRRRQTHRRLAAKLANRGAAAPGRLAALALAVADGLALARLGEPQADLGGLVTAAAELLDGYAEGVAQRQDDAE